MNRFNGPAIKWIVIMGAGTFLVLMVGAWGLRHSLKPQESQRVSISPNHSRFDGKRAYADLEKIVGFGPRPAGSKALESCRSYIKHELQLAGLDVHEESFQASTPLGQRTMVNVYGVVQGTEPGVIVISNHYDTKLFNGFRFVGANDGGSTTAWMLELARTLGPKRQGHTIWLVFFDGEEALVKWSETDSLYGSREFVQKHIENGNRDDIQVAINVDMIGDCYLGIFRDPRAPEWLSSLIWDKARKLGYGTNFLAFGIKDLQDDHIPFRRAGVECINLIDFSYGGSQVEHKQNWHTVRDTIDRVCWQSLQAVGDVIYDVLPEIDSHLTSSGRRGP